MSPDSSLTDIYATKPAAKLSTPGAGATPAALAADMLAGKTQPRRGWGSLFGLAPAYERLEAAHVD